MGDPTGAKLSDEELRKLLKPNPTTDEVIDAIKASYCTSGQTVKLVRELESYDDRNYWIEISGTPYLAKVHNGVESNEFLRLWKEDDKIEASAVYLQNSIMEHLCNHGIMTSRPIEPVTNPDPTATPPPPTAARIHAFSVVSEKDSPCDLVLRLLRWVPGRTMASANSLPLEAIVDAGRFLGKLSQKLDLLDANKLGASKRFHQWDGKNTFFLKSFIGCIQDEGKRNMIDSILTAFQKDIIDSGDSNSFKQGLLHGDFNDANIIVDDDFKVSGVLDFGDSVLSWRVLDLTVAMAYAMLTVYGKQNRSISAAAALLRGYHSVNPLSEIERRHLILLVACRLACSVTLGAYSYQQNPKNEYLLLHAVPAWDCLELIWGTDTTKRRDTAKLIDGVFDVACNKSSPKVDDVLYCSDLNFPDPSLVDPMVSARVTTMNGNDRPTKRLKDH